MMRKYGHYLLVPVLLTLLSCKKDPVDLFLNGKIDKYNAVVQKSKQYILINDDNHNGITPLLLAIKNQDKSSYELYIKNGCDLSDVDNNGQDVFSYALQATDDFFLHDVIPRLSNRYWNSKDTTGTLKLVSLIKETQDHDLISYVIKKTQDINAVDNKGKTPLMYAAQCNLNAIVTKLLLDAGAKINARNDNEWTAIMYALRYNLNPLVFDDLLIRGADTAPNSVGLSPIMLAACNDNPGMLLEALLKLDGINAQTTQGKTALMYAFENHKSAATIQLLLKHGADPNIKDITGKTAMMYACQSATDKQIFTLLLNYGADVLIKDKHNANSYVYLDKNPLEKKKKNDIYILLTEFVNSDAKPKTEETTTVTTSPDSTKESTDLSSENVEPSNPKDNQTADQDSTPITPERPSDTTNAEKPKEADSSDSAKSDTEKAKTTKNKSP